MAKLDDDEMRNIAVWKVECLTNQEIAVRLGRTERTVERKLHRIRQIWKSEISMYNALQVGVMNRSRKALNQAGRNLALDDSMMNRVCQIAARYIFH